MYKRKISDGLREVATAYDGIAQNLFNAARLLEENEEYNLEERAINAVRIAESSTVPSALSINTMRPSASGGFGTTTTSRPNGTLM